MLRTSENILSMNLVHFSLVEKTFHYVWVLQSNKEVLLREPRVMLSRKTELLSRAKTLTGHLEKKKGFKTSTPKPTTPPRFSAWSIGSGRGNILRDISLPESMCKYLFVT